MTLDALARDTRHGVRTLVRDWRFTVAAVLILGLGIGANTAMFSLINAALLRKPSLAEPDRLVDIYQNAVNPGGVDRVRAARRGRTRARHRVQQLGDTASRARRRACKRKCRSDWLWARRADSLFFTC